MIQNVFVSVTIIPGYDIQNFMSIQTTKINLNCLGNTVIKPK